MVARSSRAWGAFLPGGVAGGRELPDYLTTDEVAALLGYNTAYVRQMAVDGKLRADKKSRIWLFYRDDVEAFRSAVAGKAKHDPTRQK